MKRFLLILSLTIFSNCFAFRSFACINGITKILTNGLLLYVDEESNVPRGHHFVYPEDFKRELNELDSIYKTTKDLDYLSDRGVILILLGRYREAIDLYLEIEKQIPNRYSTASNMGTAYELVGDNENALKWIRRAVEIDSSSHNNSEWIHVNILEAKIKGKNYYTTKHLLNTDFGIEDEPSSEMHKEELAALQKSLYYQLNERISFIKEQDKIVAQLLFDLGNITFLLGEHNDAIEDYQLSQSYGLKGELVKIRIKESKHQINSQQRIRWFKKYGGPLVGGIALLIGVIWLIRFVISKQMNS